MSYRIASLTPTAPVNANLSDQEVLNQIMHAYPRLGGALGEAMRRYQHLVDVVNGVVPFPNFEPEKVNCPHCGSALIISEQKGNCNHAA